MPNIKIKNVAKGTIKTIDKTAIISGRMKNSFVRTKDKAEEELLPDDNSPVEYAVNRVSNAADKGAHKSAHGCCRVRKIWGQRHKSWIF